MRNFPFLRTALFVSVMCLGAIEGWYSRTDYAQDAISYLSVTHAVAAHEWKTALNPLWSIGYPLLILCVRPLFPADGFGEWDSVHLLNLLIFAATYLTFLFAVNQASLLNQKPEEAATAPRSDFLLIASTLVFLCTELCIDGVSRVGPDLLVSCLFFAALGLMLSFLRNPTRKATAYLLGAVLGFGYLTKLVFIPLSVLLLSPLVFSLWRRKLPLQGMLRVVAMLLLFVIPYASAQSWALGRFTLGESGAINYEFHVNRIPRFIHWQGGPAQYGNPIHPTRKLMENPPVFEFGEPFHTTYPPFNNIVYWYEGYKHFWKPKLQIEAFGRGGYQLLEVLWHQPMLYFLLACIGFVYWRSVYRSEWRMSTWGLWPFFLPALAGVFLYMQVHLEGRYIPSFLAILGILPIVSMVRTPEMLTKKTCTVVLAMLGLGAAVNLAVVDRSAVIGAIHRVSYRQDPQWRLAEFLTQDGLKPGDQVASINWIPGSQCTWAEADGLRIVAEIGNDAYDHDHPERNIPLFWKSSPELREQVYGLFRQSGAVAVVAPWKPDEVNAPGWQKAGTSGWWVFLLR